jgi:hypothetical protein
MLQFLKGSPQEVKTERKWNCSRAHRRCRKIQGTEIFNQRNNQD